MSDGNLWERQSGETPKAFAAFCLYRDIPPLDRSVRAAVESFRKQGGKTSERNWETWASRYICGEAKKEATVGVHIACRECIGTVRSTDNMDWAGMFAGPRCPLPAKRVR